MIVLYYMKFLTMCYFKRAIEENKNRIFAWIVEIIIWK